MAYTTINKSGDYFNTKLYTGNNGTNAITGVGFQPDFNWIKDRTSTGEHLLVDAVRGMYNIRSNSTAAESANGSIHQQSLDSDGFTVAGSAGNSNASGRNYASWNWKANGAGSANTDGSINSTVSVNTTAGFSIVRWSGSAANATIGHGLGAVPKMIICKDTNDTYNWGVYHQGIGNTKYLYLNTTAAEATSSSLWNNTTPTSTVFSVGNAGASNSSGTNNMIAYCFAEKTGYSKFGSYTGNGSTDGTFVYTGFKPSWLMIKRTNSAENWHIYDIKRNPYYPTSSSYGGMATRLIASSTGGDDLSQGGFEFLSNGLKMTTSWSGGNGNGDTFIYMCFGQSLVGSNNVPCTAR